MQEHDAPPGQAAGGIIPPGSPLKMDGNVVFPLREQSNGVEQVLERGAREGLRVAFVNRLSFNEPLGIGYLGSYLKANHPGISVAFFDVNQDILERLRHFSPHLVLYSVMTGEHERQFTFNQSLKQRIPNFIAVFGGPHPTYFPQCIERDGVDIICRGEGEQPLHFLVEAITNRQDIRFLDGLWVKLGNEIHRNDVRTMIADLDQLPFPDRDLYYDHSSFLLKYGRKPVVGARGCPFQCSYCYNSGMLALFQNKGKVLRVRSPSSVVAEVAELKKRYDVAFVAFIEDVFPGVRIDWIKEFHQRYLHVGVPFFTSMRAEFVTPQIAEYLRKSGCVSVSMAVEHGDEAYRKQYMFRKMTNQQLIDGTRILEEAGIRVASPIMLGMPFAPFQGDLETLKLVCQSRPTHATTAIFQPYPGTALTEMCQQEGLIESAHTDNLPDNFFVSANIKGVDYASVTRLHNTFSIILRLNRIFGWDPEVIYRRLPDNLAMRLLNSWLKYRSFKMIINYRRGILEMVREVYQGLVTGVFDVGIKIKRRSPWSL